MKNKKNKIELKWKFINTIMFFIILIMSGYYVGTVNDLTIKDLKRHEIKKEINYKKEINRELKAEVLARKSYNKITERVNKLSMVSIDKVDYIEVNENLELALITK